MNNSNIGTAIRKIIDIEGDAILLNSRRFCAILDDLAIDSRKESKIIRRGITDILLKMFYDVRVGSISDVHTKVRRIEMYIRDELGLSAEWNNCIICAFSDAFDWSYTPTICVETTTQLPSNHTEELTVENTAHENALLMGFMDYEMGKQEDARNTFRSILMQDISCAGAYLGMLLICDKDEQMTYDQKFRQYATDHMSSFEKKIYTNKTKDSLLRIYLRHKDYNRISSALDLHGNITPELFYEAITQNPDSRLVHIFLDHGFDKNSTIRNHYSDGSDASPIISQLMYNRASAKIIENLLKAGFNPNAERIFQNKSGKKNRYSLLSDSIWRAKNVHYVDILLRYGANVHFVNKTHHAGNIYSEKSMLHEAVLENNIEMVKLLIDHGADANSCRLRRTQYGDEYYSVLSDSVWNTKNTEVVELLIQNGADVNYIDIVPSKDGIYAEKPLLSEAVLSNNIEMVRLLLNHGADPNAVRLYRCNEYDEYLCVLGDATWKLKNIDLVRLLLEHGSNASRCDEKHFGDGHVKKTCMLHYAVEHAKSKEIVLLLHEHGASVEDTVTYNGKNIPFKRYPYKCGYPLNSTLEKIGWKGPKLFGLF